MNTYEIIKDLAKQKKLSIRQLELKFGYSNGYIGSWKRQTPNSTELARLTDYFNVSVDYLLGRTDIPNPFEVNTDSYKDELLMMFRRDESEVPAEKKELYRKQVTDLMGFIFETMKELDDDNKNT